MRAISRRFLYPILLGAIAWLVVTGLMVVTGGGPHWDSLVSPAFRLQHPALSLWTMFLLDVAWALGPAWLLFKLFRHLMRSTAMPSKVAHQVVQRFEEIVVRNGFQTTPEQLPASVEEMEKAIQVVLRDVLAPRAEFTSLSKARVDSLRTAYCYLEYWDHTPGTFPTPPELNVRRNEEFSEILLRTVASITSEASTRGATSN